MAKEKEITPVSVTPTPIAISQKEIDVPENHMLIFPIKDGKEVESKWFIQRLDMEHLYSDKTRYAIKKKVKPKK